MTSTAGTMAEHKPDATGLALIATAILGGLAGILRVAFPQYFKLREQGLRAIRSEATALRQELLEEIQRQGDALRVRDEEISRLWSRVRDMEAQIREGEDARKDLTIKLDSKQQEVTVMQLELKSQRDNSAAQDRKIFEQQQEIEHLKGVNRRLLSKLEELEPKVSTLERKERQAHTEPERGERGPQGERGDRGDRGPTG